MNITPVGQVAILQAFFLDRTKQTNTLIIAYIAHRRPHSRKHPVYTSPLSPSTCPLLKTVVLKDYSQFGVDMLEPADWEVISVVSPALGPYVGGSWLALCFMLRVGF